MSASVNSVFVAAIDAAPYLFWLMRCWPLATPNSSLRALPSSNHAGIEPAVIWCSIQCVSSWRTALIGSATLCFCQSTAMF